VTSAYDLGNRLLTSTPATTYQHDVNGNMTLAQSPTESTMMSYDYENRMIAEVQGSTAATNIYDGYGFPRAQIVNGTISTLVWDRSELLQVRS